MPIRIATNWESAFIRFASDPPVKIGDVVCCTDEPTEDEYAEDRVYVGLDFGSSAPYTFDIEFTRKQFKTITRLAGVGNNWRRMHGKKLIRVPLKERRIKNGEESIRY